MLGKRKPEIYGTLTLDDINKRIKEFAVAHNVAVDIMQSNREGDIIDTIHKAQDYSGLVINPAGYTHYSVAIRDAIESIDIPTIEVHISNIYARESFRKKSVIAPVCVGQISGMGWQSYILAIEYLVKLGE
jgi:3-dehydroquinate dehydratase-2